MSKRPYLLYLVTFGLFVWQTSPHYFPLIFNYHPNLIMFWLTGLFLAQPKLFLPHFLLAVACLELTSGTSFGLIAFNFIAIYLFCHYFRQRYPELIWLNILAGLIIYNLINVVICWLILSYTLANIGSFIINVTLPEILLGFPSIIIIYWILSRNFRPPTYIFSFRE